MPKKILILLGFLFLTILLLNTVSATDMCWFELNSADCMDTSGGQVVMDLSSSTNAHGALEGQGNFPGVLCCNFGAGVTTCSSELDPDTNQPINKIIGLSSSTNAHAEAPDLASPSYNTNNVCYDSLNTCRETTANCGTDEIPVLYISSITNAHIEGASGQSQNYESKICCIVKTPTAQCDLTSAEWQFGEAMVGTDVGAIVNGVGCDGVEISFEVFRGSTSCDDIDGCTNPENAVFGAGSNSVTGTWNAIPSHNNEYSFVATVVTDPSETVPSSAPDLLVLAGCPYDPEPVICKDYTTESHCNSNVCEIDIQDSVPSFIDCDDSDINCECVWNSTESECKASWGLIAYCGNDVINPGETCDGIDWGSITGCSNFDVFTSGNLECYAPETSNECQFDTSSCIGTGSYCGDGVIDAGETCDGSDWGSITDCSNFDVFTGGSLSCGTDCQFDTTQCTGPPPGVCGDGVINTGETCDGIVWGPITSCNDFDLFTGGSLSCDSTTCQFDTSRCTGGPGGYCGNDIIDAGETCDGSSDWGPITSCNDFDLFTGGTLMCTDCQFDTLQCTGGPGDSEIGTCIYTQSTEDNCDDGWLNFSWTAEWTWDEGCPPESQCRDDNQALAAECEGGSAIRPCPAQLPLRGRPAPRSSVSGLRDRTGYWLLRLPLALRWRTLRSLLPG